MLSLESRCHSLEMEWPGDFETVFLKQFGEMRTGTNYLRSLLQANYPEVVVLMHILGDKHSPPAEVPFPAGSSPEEAYQWVRTVTLKAPAASSRVHDPAQQAQMRVLAPGILDAARSGRLGYILSVKNPYAWGASMADYCHWLPRGMPKARRRLPFLPDWAAGIWRRVDDRCACFHLSRACRRFNDRHRAWLHNHNRFEGRSVIVKYEDLLGAPAATLRSIEERFSLKPAGTRVESLAKVVLWSDWDHLQPPPAQTEFDPSYYPQKKFERLLTPRMRQTISRHIDWGLMSEFGYRVES